MGGKQAGFGNYKQTTAQKPTKHQRILYEMEEVVP